MHWAFWHILLNGKKEVEMFLYLYKVLNKVLWYCICTNIGHFLNNTPYLRSAYDLFAIYVYSCTPHHPIIKQPMSVSGFWCIQFLLFLYVLRPLTDLVYPTEAPPATSDRFLHSPSNQVVACMPYKTTTHPSLSFHTATLSTDTALSKTFAAEESFKASSVEVSCYLFQPGHSL